MESDPRQTGETTDGGARPRGGRGSRSSLSVRRIWLLPAILMTVLALLTGVLCSVERQHDLEQARAEAAVTRIEFARRIETAWRDRMRRVMRQLRSGRWQTPATFADDARALPAEAPAVTDLAWIDRTDVCRAEVPADPPVLLGKRLTSTSRWTDLLAAARTNGLGSVGEVDATPGRDPSVDVVVLAQDADFVTTRPTAAAPGPEAIACRIDVARFLDEVTDSGTKEAFGITVSDRGRPFYRTPVESSAAAAGIGDDAEPVRLLDRTWTLRLTPNDRFYAAHVSHAPTLSLWVVLAGIVVVVVSLYQSLAFRRHEAARVAEYARSMERLSEYSASIGARIGSAHEVLHRIPEAACALLHTDMSSISLLEDAGKTVHIIAGHGVFPPLDGQKVSIDHLPSVRLCVQTGEVVMVPDCEDDPQIPLNRPMARRYRIRSMMQVPLIVEGKTVGVILLGCNRPRRFTPDEVRLAELWGSQAAVALVNTQLCEQLNHGIDAEKRLVEQRDALVSFTTEIYRPGPIEDVLDRIANLAPVPLGVDSCIVNLLDEHHPDQLYVGAATAPFPPRIVGARYPLRGSKAEQAFLTREPVVVEDVVADGSINPKLQVVARVGSLIVLPLFATDGRPLGVAGMMRAAVGKFTPEQVDLCRMFAVRAAAAIENARLQQQARRDADAKAMLLRELNHRVKNNLAGIVGLLSMSDRHLPPDAQEWLERVVERIRTMANAHDLFSGGLERVSLKELVDQTLRGVSTIKPSGVRMETDVTRVAAKLRTDRAVTVAMVLHELCYNAVVHGLGGGGVLVVRAELVPPTPGDVGQRLRVEVIDDGHSVRSEDGAGDRGSSATAVTAQRRVGIGLALVRNMVGRELRGTFTLNGATVGGTSAALEFPLLADEVGE